MYLVSFKERNTQLSSNSELGVYISCVQDLYLRKNLVSSMGNLNSSLCYQTRVKLQRFAPLLAGADMR